MRILDLIVMLLTGLLSFSLSVTIHAGLDNTCSQFLKHDSKDVTT